MNNGIAKRRAYLTAQKNAGQRVTIGFAGIADFRSYMGQEYIAGMMKAASDYDINFINMAGAIKYSLFDDIDFISHYMKTFRFMKAPLIDGLVTWASSLCSFLDSKTIVNTFSSLKPLPMVDIGYLDIPDVPSIRIDNTISIQLIIQHLVKIHRYNRFAFFGSKISTPHARRLSAYKSELAKNNIEELPDSVYMAKTMDPLDIAQCVDQLCSQYNLKHHESFDVIVTSSDIIASILIDELDKRGINVPEDIAVTGFNNQYKSITAQSPVTTVNLEYFKRGYAAVELLIDRIISPSETVNTKLVPTSLIVRQSCGCFEKSVIEAGNHNALLKDVYIDINASEDEVREYLSVRVKSVFPTQSLLDIDDLVNAVFLDIYDKNEVSCILRWFRTLLQKQRKAGHLDNYQFQLCISNLRRIIIPMVKDDEEQFLHLEDIFQQLRALVALYVQYDNMSQQNSAYMMTNLSHIAISFASATTGKQIQDVLRYQLSEMEIPGIVLVLCDSMASDLSSASIEMILPEPPEEIKSRLPYKVYDPACIPKRFFPRNRRYSLMLEILYHSDHYFGYSFLEMGSQNISLYDTVRMLLSNALHSVYVKEGRTREHSMLLNGDQLVGILHLQDNENREQKNGVTVRQITNYLVEHLNEMTNLDKMSEELLVSKSHLVRRCKELTGYTIQTLHEKLKIEQAKNLLQVDTLKLSEIATRLGFQNQNYFSSVFKKNTGMSPRQWTKRNR